MLRQANATPEQSRLRPPVACRAWKVPGCPADDLDEESSAWLRRLGAAGAERRAAEGELHARLVRIALAEVRRRAPGTPVTGQELDDVAHQAADDAMLADLGQAR